MERVAGDRHLYSAFRKQLVNQELIVVQQRLLPGGSLGRIYPDKAMIVINSNQSLDRRVITLLHELLHGKYPNMVEELIEMHAMRIYQELTPQQLGFFEFFVKGK